jgi:hypothetical protein
MCSVVLDKGSSKVTYLISGTYECSLIWEEGSAGTGKDLEIGR